MLQDKPAIPRASEYSASLVRCSFLLDACLVAVRQSGRLMKLEMIWLIGFLFLTAPDAAQAQFRYRTNNNSITITGYTGTNGVVTVPDTINGLPVVSIADNSFQ